MATPKDPRQDRWNASQREHDEMVARAAEEQPDSEWVTPSTLKGWVRRQEPEKHDWEPGEDTHPMGGDPRCRICGEDKRSPSHY